MDYKIIVGTLAVVVGFIGYIPYFYGMFAKRTKPHAFSWVIWGVINGIVSAAQVAEGAGPGAFATGAIAITCFAIAAVAFKQGDRNFTTTDWGFMSAAVLAIILWIATEDPTLSVILVSIIDTIGFGPSIIKGFKKPHEETAITFALAALTYILSLFAIESYSVATWFFPVVAITVNGSFAAMLLLRRKAISQ